MVRTALSYPEGTRMAVLIDIRVPESRTFDQQLEIYMKEGYSRLEKNGEFITISDLRSKGTPDSPDGYRLLIDRLSVYDN